MKLAYADPPYIGMAHFYPEKTEVNHRVLIGTLCAEYPDGWALSCASVTLQETLALCPRDVRIGAWVKTFASFKPGVNPAYCWEPVIFRGGRQPRARAELTVSDWIACPITLRRGLVGVKPAPFWFWLFAFLGLRPGDQFDDVFPGSRAGERAWSQYVNQTVLVAAS